MTLTDAFKDLPDPRVERTKLYSLEAVILQTIVAVLTGAETWVEVAEYGEEQQEWLRKYVPLPNGTPSHDTIGDLFKRLDPKKFSSCFVRWISQVCNIPAGELIAIDGKTVRGSFDHYNGKEAIHMVSAWAAQMQLVLGQVKADDKSNEITAIPQLLGLLEVKGAIVSIDAAGCNKEIAKQIIKAKADYILALKGNQHNLHEQVTGILDKHLAPDDQFESLEKNHGRIELRRCCVYTNLGMIDETLGWPQLHTIVKIQTERTVVLTGSKSKETRYYISSLKGSAEEFARHIRAHWQVENNLHWVMDVLFNEDRSRVRKGNADANFAIIRRWVLNILKLDTKNKKSLLVKRKLTLWRKGYLEELLRF